MIRYAYVGCRTSKERGARGVGIKVYKVNDVTGKWNHVGTVKDLENPSYLSLDKEKKFLYTVHGDLTEVSAFRIDPDTGMPIFMNKVSCAGKNPVYILPDHTNKFMLVPNLGSGNIVAITRNDDGSLGPVAHQLVLPGKEEDSPSFPHQIYYDRTESFLFVPAQGRKGGQTGLSVFSFDPGKGFEAKCAIKGRDFDECRHVAVHPNNTFIYLLNERNNTVTSLFFENTLGNIEPFQISQTLPETYTGLAGAGGIVITEDGRFLYVSNRVHDSITIFKVNQQSGMLKALGWVSSQGEFPRFITIDPTCRFLYVANENGHNIVTFRVEENGGLTRTGESIETGSPVCISFS